MRKYVGERIKALREAQDMTLAQVCKLTGIPEDRLLAYEDGSAVPAIGAVIQLSRVLGSKMAGLLHGGRQGWHPRLPCPHLGLGLHAAQDHFHTAGFGVAAGCSGFFGLLQLDLVFCHAQGLERFGHGHCALLGQFSVQGGVARRVVEARNNGLLAFGHTLDHVGQSFVGACSQIGDVICRIEPEPRNWRACLVVG